MNCLCRSSCDVRRIDLPVVAGSIINLFESIKRSSKKPACILSTNHKPHYFSIVRPSCRFLPRKRFHFATPPPILEANSCPYTLNTTFGPVIDGPADTALLDAAGPQNVKIDE
ncbi:hypothetical protein CMUST_06595 [Corynebacterium mustelae]|uniref:Uncharacterized protein n=1 Tax=Corynebacterium mustelae TaxID=571915 RepID=A0A0G3GWZ6_9CORY|nr:hypothetical protein CMUST_06595 [Corynebacterium mustelae]